MLIHTLDEQNILYFLQNNINAHHIDPQPNILHSEITLWTNLALRFWNHTFTWHSVRPSSIASCCFSLWNKQISLIFLNNNNNKEERRVFWEEKLFGLSCLLCWCRDFGYRFLQATWLAGHWGEASCAEEAPPPPLVLAGLSRNLPYLFLQIEFKKHVLTS